MAQRAIDDIIKLPPLAEGILLAASIDTEGTDVYTVQAVIELAGKLDLDALRVAGRKLLDRHEMLRAAVRSDQAGRSWFVTVSGIDLPWRISEVADEAQADREELEDRALRFDVDRPPLLRALVLKLGAESYRLVLTLHHLILDGWSMPVILRDLLAFYHGKGAELPQISRYTEYVAQIQEAAKPAAGEQWKAWLAPCSGPTLLAQPRQLGNQETTRLRTDSGVTSQDLANVVQWARETGCTFASAVQVAWGLALGAELGRTEVVYGTTVSRRRPEMTGFDSIVGLFVNTVPVIIAPKANASLQETCLAHHDAMLALDNAADRGLAQIQADLGMGSLFDNLLLVENYPLDAVDEASSNGLQIVGARVQDSTQYPLTVVVMPGAGIHLDSDSAQLAPETAQRLGRRFAGMLRQMSHTEANRVSMLDVSLPEEKELRLRSEFGPDRPLAAQSWVERIVQTLSENPEAIAYRATHRIDQAAAAELADAGISRAQFLAEVAAIVSRLRSAGVNAGDTVALALPRSPRMVAAMLAVAWRGAQYVPFDPNYPVERIEQILADAAPRATLADPASAATLRQAGIADVVVLEGAGHDEVELGECAPRVAQTAAYTIFTSGSTGRPKGVTIPDVALGNLLDDMVHRFELTAQSRLCAVTPLTFDIAEFELLGTLLAGAETVLVDEGTVRDLDRLALVIEDCQISHMQATPSLWRALVEEHPESINGLRIMVGGEALPETLAEALAKGSVQTNNVYGPTETTIWSVAYPLPKDHFGAVPIGAPISRTRTLILDAWLRPCAIGAVGDLYISGSGLAHGYHGRPDLSATRFVPEPGGAPGSRMYLTGDLAKLDEHGVIHYSGRSDFQVKIRGHRIELGEVESALGAIPWVFEAVAHAHTGVDGLRQLVGYVRVEQGIANVQSGVLEHLRRALPDYMVPSHVVVLETMPLTSNGKIDRKALPAPQTQTAIAATGVTDGLTELLRTEFAGALGVDRVGADDDLFVLGGHSLTAARLVSRLRRSTGFEITLEQVFANPTARSLAAVYRGNTVTGTSVKISRRAGDAAPASRAQRRLWLLAQTGGAADAYHLPFLVRSTGKLAIEAFAAGLDDLRDRHEILRTVIRLDPVSAELEQRILPSHELAPTLRGSAVMGSAELRASLAAAFELESEAPIRAVLVTDERGEPVGVAVTIHHVAVDGTSISRLMADLETVYQARCAGEQPDLGTAQLRYLDLTADEDRDVTEGRWANGLDFWAKELADAPSELALPLERPRPQVESHHGGIVSVAVPASVLAGAEAVAKRAGVTMFMVMQSALGVLYRNLGAGEDIPLGTATTARLDLDAEQTVGPFLNTVVLRTRVAGAPSFTELLRTVRRHDVASFAHQAVPFELVLERLAVERNADRHPLFQSYLGYTVEESVASASELQLESLASDTAKFDLSFEFVENRSADSVLQLHLEYATDLFTSAGALRLGERFVRVLEQLVTQPERAVRTASVILPDDASTAALTGEHVAEPEDVLQRFLRIAQTYPDRIAVVGPDGVQQNYLQLAERAAVLARKLRDLGVLPGDVVALARETDDWSPACLLATWALDAVYLPLDCVAPVKRLGSVLEEANPRVIVSAARFMDSIQLAVHDAQIQARIIDAELLPFHDATINSVAALAAIHAKANPQPAQPAYVLFTSGSTGKPKGALIHRGGLANHLDAKVNSLGLTPDDVVVANAALTFDISLWQLLCALMVGGTTAIAARSDVGDPHALWSWAAREQTTVLEVVPSLLNVAIEAEAAGRPLQQIAGLRWLMLTGEALPSDSARAWLNAHPGDVLVNAYGPTECSDDVTHAEFRRGSDFGRTTAPIGTALQNTDLLVLNDDLQPCPAGVNGELYVAGMGVGIGYLGRPGLTSATFVADPRGGGQRFYRTGDIVAWGENGLEFKGRRDHQVKIRGHRIETAEIEAVAREIAAVNAAVVVAARRSSEQPLELFGYVAGQVTTEELERVMVERLPLSMRPSVWTVLDRLPLTANGKVDLKSLAIPVAEADAGLIEPPRGELETLICEVFANVIGVPAVGRNDDFFAIGGDSLRSVRVVTALAKAGHSVGLAQIFTHRTPAALAGWLGGSVLAEADGEGVGSFPLPPEFLRQLRRAGGLDGFDQWIVLAAEEEIDPVRWAAACQAVVERHDVLRLRWDGVTDSAEIIAPQDTTAPVQSTPQTQSIAEAIRIARTVLTVEPGRLLASRIVPGANTSHVVIAVHHLAVDAASWEVLVPDLLAAYQAEAGAAIQWSSRPATSYRSWASELAAPAQPWAEQQEYWEAVTADLALEPVVPAGKSESQSTKVTAETMKRLTDAAEHRGLGLESVLLAAFTRAISAARADMPAVVVEVEAQGRTPLRAGTDVSSTMGWFTSAFPLRVPLSNSDIASTRSELAGIEDTIATIAWQRSRVPDAGRGYAALLTDGQAAPLAEAPYSFNFLGQAGAGVIAPGWSLMPRDSSWDDATEAQLGFELTADALIEEHDGGALLVSWKWLAAAMSSEVAQAVISGFEHWVEVAVAALEEEPIPALARTLPLHAGGKEAPLFVVHGGVGLAWPYMSLLPSLPSEIPVVGLQADFNGYADSDSRGIEDLAADYVRRIQTFQSEGPYRLLGWSFGGLVVHAVTKLLEDSGETVEYLAILDSYPITEAEEIPAESWVLDQLLRIDTGDALAPTLRTAIESLDYAVIAAAWQQHGGSLSGLGEGGLRRVVQVTRAHALMGQQFRPVKVRATINLVAATLETDAPQDPHAVWQQHAEGLVRVIPVESLHDDLLNHEMAATYAVELLAPLKGLARVDS